MQDEHDDVWRWSVAFMEAVERLIGEPLSAANARRDGPDHFGWLRWWLREIGEARDLYQQEYPERLHTLYDYWRIIAPYDPKEQIRTRMAMTRSSRWK
jgi:hypothetical protein